MFLSTCSGIVSQALEVRDKAGIKVRQPLAVLTVPSSAGLSDEFLSIIGDEVNVKRVVLGKTFALDTNITDELREEGLVRDTIREIQAFRKAENLKPGEPATYKLKASSESRTIVERHLAEIQKATHTNIEFS